MRVLFLVPPYRTTDALVAGLYPMPYAAVLLGSVLKVNGHEVEIKDFLLPAGFSKTDPPAIFAGKGAPPYLHYGLPMADCLSWVEANVTRFDVVCLCAGQCNLFETSAILADKVHQMGVPLVVGGSYVTTALHEARTRFKADVFVSGEAEGVIEEACQRAVDKVPGDVYGSPWDIRQSPVPDWSLADPKGYPRVGSRVRGVLSVSRGCPHQCKFCSVHTVHGRKYRRKTAEQISTELAGLGVLGVNYFCFLDDNLFLTETAVDEMLAIISSLRESGKIQKKSQFYIEEGLEIRLAAKPGVVKKLSDAGFVNLGLGFESLNSAGLADMKKPHTKEDIAAAVAQIKSAGVRAKAFYIIGMPGDTVQSVCQNFVEFSSMGLAARANNLKLYPGTDVFKSFVTSGVVDESYDWRLSSFWTPDRPGLSYRDIKSLKAVLNGISLAAGELGVDLMHDTDMQLRTAFVAAGFSFNILDDHLLLSGNFFRASSYRNMLLFLALRFGFIGVDFKVSDDSILAVRCAEPKNIIQKELGKAIRDVLGIPGPRNVLSFLGRA